MPDFVNLPTDQRAKAVELYMSVTLSPLTRQEIQSVLQAVAQACSDIPVWEVV